MCRGPVGINNDDDAYDTVICAQETRTAQKNSEKHSKEGRNCKPVSSAHGLSAALRTQTLYTVHFSPSNLGKARLRTEEAAAGGRFAEAPTLPLSPLAFGQGVASAIACAARAHSALAAGAPGGGAASSTLCHGIS